jgi:uncharacterized protein (DUF3820 family)
MPIFVIKINKMEEVKPNPQILIDLVTMKMPYGKYKDRLLCDLPESYLVWYREKGFPPGKMGVLLETIYEIKLNGLEYLLRPLKKR